jgi:hypothetical protein
MGPITRETLRDYLNDALPDAELAAVEKALRDDPGVRDLFQQIRQDADRGEHSIGAVWRRERLSCPSRDQLGGFLLGAADPDLLAYVEFHLATIGCAYCQANLDDLKRRQDEAAEPETHTRRRRIVDSGTGVLPAAKKPGK